MANSVRYTVSVDKELLEKFRRIAKERGRSQAFYVNAALRRVVESSDDSDVPTRKGEGRKKSAVKRRRKSAKKESPLQVSTTLAAITSEANL